jgi:hypothetical protein
LILQELIGPRFFVPAALDYFPQTEAWDYFPKHLPADLESGAGQLSCVICLEAIDLPGEKEAGEDEKDSLLDKGRRNSVADIGRSLGRWSFMVPPCHHIAHVNCLESWLAIKSEW